MNANLADQIDRAEQEWLELWQKGPTRLRWTSVPLQVGDPAPDAELPDAAGQLVRLHDFWRDRPALLLFWRHFGCRCGMERARRLRQEYADYVATGANVVVIGQGEPERSAAYAAAHELPCPILSDPTYQVYQAYDLLEGLPEQIVYGLTEEYWFCDYDAGVRLAQARRDSGRPMVDSPWQLPGEFVIDRSGRVRLAYRYQYCEGYPDPRVLLAAVYAAQR